MKWFIICLVVQNILFCHIEYRKKIRKQYLNWSLNIFIDNLSYQLQSLDKQSLLFNFYVSALAFSLLQIQLKPSFLLVLIPTHNLSYLLQPKICNLRYYCNFSSCSFYSTPVNISSRYIATWPPTSILLFFM